MLRWGLEACPGEVGKEKMVVRGGERREKGRGGEGKGRTGESQV